MLGAHAAVRASPAASAALLVLLTGCSMDSSDPPAPSVAARSTPPSTAAGAVPAATPRAPTEGSCYRMDLEQALGATSDAAPRPCDSPHTARTFLVGRLDRAVNGHLLAVDSSRVRTQVAQECPAALPDLVGGGADGWRLSVLRAVWFTPTLTDADTGASWVRCDVVALDGRGGLLTLDGRLGGTLDTPTGRDRWGLCATGAPDDAQARRVPCAESHTWRAVAVVDLPGSGRGSADYPGEEAARQRGQEPCEQVGREQSSNPLEFTWGYEWPSAEQWAAGQRFGRCWVPVDQPS